MSPLRSAGVLAGILVVGALPAVAQQAAIDSAVVGFLRTGVTREAEILGRAQAFAPGRSFAVAVRSARTSGAAVTVMACIADSAATVTVACAPVPTPRIDRNLYAADTVFDRGQTDLDGDGTPELRFSLGYSTPSVAAVGPDAYRRHYVFRPAAAGPQLLVDILVREEPGASGMPQRLGRLAMDDWDQDGVQDFIVHMDICPQRMEPGADCRYQQITYAYRRATRTWARVPAGGAARNR